MPQQKDWFTENAPKQDDAQKPDWFNANAPKNEPASKTTPKTTPKASPAASAGPRRGGPAATSQEQEFQRGNQMDPVPTISNGVRGTVSTSGSNAGKDFIPFGGKPFQTAKGAERGISLDAPPDIQTLLPSTNTPTPKNVVQLREEAKPPAPRQFKMPLDTPNLEAMRTRLRSLVPTSLVPSPRSVAGATGAMIGGTLGSAAGPVGAGVGAGAGFPAGTRAYDWMRGSRPTSSVAEDVLSGVLQESGGPIIAKGLQVGIPAAGGLVGHVLSNEGIGGIAGELLGHHLGYTGLEGGAGGYLGSLALKRIMQTPAFQAASVFVKRQVIDLMSQGATQQALGLLASQASTPVIEGAKRTIAPQPSALGPKNPQTRIQLSPEDERDFRQYVQNYNPSINPDAPNPDFDYRKWWLDTRKGKAQ